jgi:Sigma-70 region 2
MRNLAVIFLALYREAWLKARAIRPRHKAFSDEFLWHDAYDFYAETLPRLTKADEAALVRGWQDDGDEDARARLLEAFYYTVRPIAGQIATKRFPPGLWPSQRTIPKAAKHAYDGHRDRIHELASVGIFGLFVAADRFNPASGHRFSTYANKWVRNYIQLYGEEIVSVVPRAGDKLDLGRVSVMDRIDAALEGRRLYRGKAAAGMAVFDAGFFLDGIETEDGSKLPNFEYLSTEGPTREYLQRRVGVGGARFVWPKTVSREVIAPWEKPNPLDDVEFTRGKREIMPKPPHTICWRVIRIDGKDRYHFLPHEVCYLAKQRPDRQFNSDDKFGDVTELKPKPQLMPKYRTPHYRNGRVIAFEYLRRSAKQVALGPCRVGRGSRPSARPAERPVFSNDPLDTGIRPTMRVQKAWARSGTARSTFIWEIPG